MHVDKKYRMLVTYTLKGLSFAKAHSHNVKFHEFSNMWSTPKASHHSMLGSKKTKKCKVPLMLNFAFYFHTPISSCYSGGKKIMMSNALNLFMYH